MLEYFLPAHARVLLYHKAPLYKVLSIGSYMRVVREFQRFSINIIEVLIVTSRRPRRVPENDLIKHKAQTPYIGLSSVSLASEELRSHVDGCPADVFQFLVSHDVGLAGKPEVSDLVNTVFAQNIRWFYISVDISFADEDSKSIDDISKGLEVLFFAELATGEVFP